MIDSLQSQVSETQRKVEQLEQQLSTQWQTNSQLNE